MSEDLFATEKVYELVKQGIPFREAYQKVKKEILG
jgi:argininosuccinate lyase